jgi:hypothetical protein
MDRQSPLRASLVDCSHSEIVGMWDNRNRVLHEQEYSVARDLQIQQITAEFDMGPSGLAPAAQVHFLRGLPSLLRQQLTYQTA